VAAAARRRIGPSSSRNEKALEQGAPVFHAHGLAPQRTDHVRHTLPLGRETQKNNSANEKQRVDVHQINSSNIPRQHETKGRNLNRIRFAPGNDNDPTTDGTVCLTDIPSESAARHVRRGHIAPGSSRATPAIMQPNAALGPPSFRDTERNSNCKIRIAQGRSRCSRNILSNPATIASCVVFAQNLQSSGQPHGLAGLGISNQPKPVCRQSASGAFASTRKPVSSSATKSPATLRAGLPPPADRRAPASSPPSGRIIKTARHNTIYRSTEDPFLSRSYPSSSSARQNPACSLPPSEPQCTVLAIPEHRAPRSPGRACSN